MLDNLSRQFANVIKKFGGQGRLSESNIADALADIRTALIDADVALPVADAFLARVKESALGIRADSLNPGRMFIAIVHRQLAQMMGEGANSALNLKKPPAVVMICGLQGAGKTTTLAKIAKHLKTQNKKRVLLASVDVHRPAAIEQLRQLAESAGIGYFDSGQMGDGGDALARAAAVLPMARRQLADAVLVDTAGRTTLDAAMMTELAALAKVLKPSETLFAVDAMQGRDAVNTAAEFGKALPLTGIVLTKFDGDSRGGAALSAKAVTGCPIKFVGTGEKPDDMELFHPARFAGRLLGMGDIAGLADMVRGKTAAAKTITRGDFNLNDQLAQLREMKKMGGIKSVLEKMPGNLGAQATDDAPIRRMESAILSMTPAERANPDMIKSSRKRRIAGGAGIGVSDVNQMLRQFEQTRKVMKKLAKQPGAAMRIVQSMMGR
ncbi:MAG: signal recognition particle protein [Gammaproteobacteria bacterium]